MVLVTLAIKYKIKQYYIIENIIIIPYGSIKQYDITYQDKII